MLPLSVSYPFHKPRPKTQAYAAKLTASGVRVRHQVYEGLVHAYAMLFEVFPEADATVGDIVAFLNE